MKLAPGPAKFDASAAEGANGAAALVFARWRRIDHSDLPVETENSLAVRKLPPNQWIRWREELPGNWSRQGHSSIAFDRKRATLAVFGSDANGQDQANALDEFHPRRKRWETHQPATGPAAHRIEATRAPIAGEGALQPGEAYRRRH